MKNKKKIFCFDIDGTICTQRKGDYKNAKPYLKVKKAINYLYDNGHTIIFFTSRFMNRYKGNKKLIKKYGYTFTKKQLIKWGLFTGTAFPDRLYFPFKLHLSLKYH